MKITQIPIEKVKLNEQNPRIIKDARFEKLLKSVREFPEMASARPIVINKQNVILGGNQRFKAMQEAGWKTVPVVIVDWPEEKQREFVVKDNSNYGEWDYVELLNFAEPDLLKDWGVDFPTEKFEPNLSPEFQYSPVDEKDIDKASGNIGINEKIAETIEVICPECGTGALYENKVIENYTGIDPSPIMLKRFAERYPDVRTSLIITKAENLVKLKKTYDNVIAIFSGSYVSEIEIFKKLWSGNGTMFLMFYKENYTPVAHQLLKIIPRYQKWTKSQLDEHFHQSVMEFNNYYIVSL